MLGCMSEIGGSAVSSVRPKAPAASVKLSDRSGKDRKCVKGAFGGILIFGGMAARLMSTWSGRVSTNKRRTSILGRKRPSRRHTDICMGRLRGLDFLLRHEQISPATKESLVLSGLSVIHSSFPS